MKYITTIGDHEFAVEILDDGRVQLNGKIHSVDFEEISEHRLYSLIIDGRSVEAYVYPTDEGLQVLYQGRFYPVQVEDERERRLRQAATGEAQGRGEFTLKAPMPGLVVAIPVQEGQAIAKGDVLVILESMKMQNELKAPRAGTMVRLRVAVGDRVEQQAALLTIA